MSTAIEMPQYNCHKTVHALEIESIVPIQGGARISFAKELYAAVDVTDEWFAKHNPASGGYYVVYKDGYTSYSPKGAFEGGYTIIDQPKQEIRTIKNDPDGTTVNVLDEPGPGGACHAYEITGAHNHMTSPPLTVRQSILFQLGPINTNGVNGCQIEDLLLICQDRLEGFQRGEFRCEENAIALNHVREAFRILGIRTADRKNRGVEGENKP